MTTTPFPTASTTTPAAATTGRTRRVRRLAAALLVAATGATAAPTAASALAGPAGCGCTAGDGAVLHARKSADAGAVDVWRMNSDGTGAVRLTSTPGYDGQPSSSPGRSRIVFATNRDTPPGASPNFELYVMNADGSNQTRLTWDAKTDWEPSWSPVADRILFTSQRDGDSEIFVVNPDGTGLTQLTHNSLTRDSQPQWSPDGTQIVFTSDRHTTSGGSSSIYVMNADGSNVRRITTYAGYDESPSFSPSGGAIAFHRELPDGNIDVYMVIPGKGWTQPTLYSRLTTNPGFDGDPTWTTDGRVAFSSADAEPSTDSDIRVVRTDGTGLVTIGSSALWEGTPFWQKPAQPTNG